MPSQYLSWQHLSISGISQLLLTQFWPNFKGRFLGQSLIDANCYGDIYPGNICPGNICTYHQPSFFLFNHKFKSYCQTSVKVFRLKVDFVLPLSQEEEKQQQQQEIYLDPKLFWIQHIFWHKFFLTKIFFWQKICFGPKIFFWPKIFFGPQIFFWTQNFFWTQHFFSGQNFFFVLKIFGPKIFFRPKIFSNQNFFRPKIIFGLIFSRPKTMFGGRKQRLIKLSKLAKRKGFT